MRTPSLGWRRRAVVPLSCSLFETEPLGWAVSRHWRVPDDRIEVIDLGVDADLFHPRDGVDLAAFTARAGREAPRDAAAGCWSGDGHCLGRTPDAFALVES